MIISMIAAKARNGVIGKENKMPWHLPADFAWFKRCTMGKPIIMGRKTYESIGRPLPERMNIVVSRQSLQIDGVTSVHSVEEALNTVADSEEVMIIGGGSIYASCLPRAHRLYLTLIDEDIEGDTVFPDVGDSWFERHREHYLADEKNAFDMDFIILERG